MSLMKDKALKWAIGYQKEWYRYRDSPQNMDRDTRCIMIDFESFAYEMETVFRKTNIEREAVAKIYRLRQRGSLNNYMTEFLNLNVVLEWKKDALIPLYEKGLSEEIKDIMIYITQPNRLRPLIEKVRAINHNIQERRNDKKYRWQLRFQKKE
jgi:Retrotransposon gag protein